MSLDTLFEQILVTEQQLTERATELKEVKMAIIRCREEVKIATEKYENTSERLEKKTQQLCAMRLQRDLMKKSKEQMLKQIEELLCQKSRLGERLAKIKRESKEEEVNFLQELSRFNSDFSLRGNRETVFESQMRAEILDLDSEVETLNKEMELMRSRSSHLSFIQEEKRALQFKLQGLKKTQKDLDQQLIEAEAVTETLRAESLFVSQKPLTDSTCLRLRNELQMHKDDDLDVLRETLSSEIHFLKSKLDGSQAVERH